MVQPKNGSRAIGLDPLKPKMALMRKVADAIMERHPSKIYNGKAVDRGNKTGDGIPFWFHHCVVGHR